LKNYLNCKINKKIRLIINHQGKKRYLFWFYVTRDGSFQLSTGYKKFIMSGYGSKQLEKSPTRINYDETKYLTNKEDIEKSHFTYHASGAIHIGLQKSYGLPLRDLNKQIHICSVLFEHPYNFPIIEHTRVNDTFLKCSIDENAPLQCKIYVAPKNNWKKVSIVNFTNQDNRRFCFSKLLVTPDFITPDLVYQIVIGHGPKGVWPKETFIDAIGSKTKHELH